jgi:hypothetical protein
MRDIRLGDDIDDYCVRCKRVMNHAVVSVISGAPAKVRCRTCHSDHDFRHEQAPPPKVDARKAALFHEVLKKVNPEEAAAVEAEAEGVPEIEIGAEAEIEIGADAGIGAGAEIGTDAEIEIAEVAVVEEAPPVKKAPKAKAKAKPKPKAKGTARK